LERQLLAQKLINGGRVLWRSGQADFTSGHISARLADQPDAFLMKAASMGLEEMTPENILTVGLDGRVISGTSKIHKEVPIHSEIYRERPDVNCVVHVHPIHVIAFFSLGLELKPVSNDGTYFQNRVSIFSETSDLITARSVGTSMARCLGANSVVVLRNHGLVTAGSTIQEAVWLALRLERACQIQLLAEGAGGPRHVASSEDAAMKAKNANNDEVHSKIFDYLVRASKREDEQRGSP